MLWRGIFSGRGGKGRLVLVYRSHIYSVSVVPRFFAVDRGPSSVSRVRLILRPFVFTRGLLVRWVWRNVVTKPSHTCLYEVR